MPSATSGIEIQAERAMTLMSQASASTAPPPTQGPSIAAIVTWSSASMAATVRSPIRAR